MRIIFSLKDIQKVLKIEKTWNGKTFILKSKSTTIGCGRGDLITYYNPSVEFIIFLHQNSIKYQLLGY